MSKKAMRTANTSQTSLFLQSRRVLSVRCVLGAQTAWPIQRSGGLKLSRRLCSTDQYQSRLAMNGTV